MYDEIMEQTQLGSSLYKDAQFRILIENSADAIQIVTPEGVVLFCSDSVESILGYTPNEIEGVNALSYLHPDNLPGFMKKWQKMLQKPLARTTLEYRVKHKNGQWIWVETTATNHTQTPGIEAVLGNFRNITERKRAEERLKESERQFRVLSDLSPVAITVHAAGKILYLNRAGAKMIGAKSPKEIIGQPIAQFVHPDYLPAVAERVRIIMTENRPTPPFFEKFVRLDGSVIDVEVISIPITYNDQKAVQVVIRDVTEPKKAEEALKESEQRLRFMAESLPQKIFTADAHGVVDYVNPQWLDYAGLTLRGFLSNSWAGIIHPDELELVQKQWLHSVKTGTSFSMEMRYKRKDGEYRRHIVHAEPMRDENGKVVKWFGSNTDIEDMRAALDREHALEKRTLQLAEQRMQLIELNKVKDEFIAVASHQLRTPATAVKQYLGMILQGYAGDIADSHRALLAKAYSSNNRQINIVNDLLQVAKVDSESVVLAKKPTDLGKVLEESVDELRETFNERQQKVILHRSTAVREVTIDPIKIRMVFENILSNASKYSYGSTVIRVGLRYDKRWARITFHDQGVGIADEDMSKLYKKFSRIDNPLSVLVGGSGLGLYLAHKIVELHGGKMTVTSQPNKGTTFVVSLPLR